MTVPDELEVQTLDVRQLDGRKLDDRKLDVQRLDARQLADAAELLRTLGTPHRLAIVLELASSPRCVHELVERIGISQSLASQHLRVLRTTGLVTGTRRGKETVYSLADEHVAHIARDALTHGAEPHPSSRFQSEPTTEPTTEPITDPITEPTTEEHQP